jgi:oligopeptide/dipeptide ABC transporter ATP-binding protein
VNKVLVKAVNVKQYFPVGGGIVSRKNAKVHAVDDVSFDIYERETLALVGESGCGKSTLGRALIRLLDITEGEVYFENKNIFNLKEVEMRKLRRQMQIIFQDPYASLNPRMTVKDIIMEPILTHKIFKGKDAEDRVKELLELVGLRPSFMSRYPHMFSGGQRQRIGIARALALNPKFIVCDEPVSALDVSIQSQIINLLEDLQEKNNLTYLFISHDLNVVKHIADRVCVMFLGKIMEMGPTKDVYINPIHPYTKFLIAAAPIPNPNTRFREKLILKGDIPSPITLPLGCRFHTRCPYAKDKCRIEEPEIKQINNRTYACHFPLQ